MSTEPIHRIELLHALYCQHCSRKLPLDIGRQHEWFDLIAAIRDMDCPPERAVVLVADRLKRLIKAKQRWESALDFRNFVGRTGDIVRKEFSEDHFWPHDDSPDAWKAKPWPINEADVAYKFPILWKESA